MAIIRLYNCVILLHILLGRDAEQWHSATALKELQNPELVVETAGGHAMEKQVNEKNPAHKIIIPLIIISHLKIEFDQKSSRELNYTSK